MGREQDDLIKRDEARRDAARAKGRECARCGEVIEFDDAQSTEDVMFCSLCRSREPKD